MVSHMSNQLRNARRKANLTQADLGGIIGRTQGTVSKYESGALRPDVDAAPAIARALGLSVLEVIYGDHSNPRGEK